MKIGRSFTLGILLVLLLLSLNACGILDNESSCHNCMVDVCMHNNPDASRDWCSKTVANSNYICTEAVAVGCGEPCDCE